MNGKQLKNSILQWAIQGKLVPQDPNDEPASALLERIRAEKARLVKEKTIKKDKNESIIYRGEDNSYYEKFLATGEVKCIDDEIPFEIPQGWEWCRLRNIIKGTNAGKSPNCEKRPKNNEEWGVLTTTAIQENEFLPSENKVLPQSYKINLEHSVKYGDILITRAGPINRTGIVCMVDKECDKLILSDKTVRIDYMSNYCNPAFIVFVLNCPAIHELLMRVTVGMAASQVNISQENIQNALIPFPCINEQNRIVEKITNLNTMITKYDFEQQQLEELNVYLTTQIKKSILQEAIQGKLVPQIVEEGTAQELIEQIRQEKQKLVKESKLKKSALTDSIIYKGDDNKYYEQVGQKCLDITERIPFEIPENWVWTRLSYIANIYTGNSISETEKRLKFTDVVGRYYIGTKDVDFSNRVIYDNGIAIPRQYEPDFRLAPNNSILMCIEGGSAGRKIAILNQDVCFGNKLCCFSPFVGIGKYIYYYLQSPLFFELFNLNKTGIIGGVSIAKVKEILIPLPSIKEQQRIVAQIEKLFEQLR